MKESSSSNGKAIKVSPEELIFDQVVINQSHSQQLQMKNNLSAPVELTLKSSNSERVDIEPKFKKLAPFESFQVEVTVRLSKALPQKTQKQKETIFIKSDFFDQKVNITIIPVFTQATTPRETSLGSSNRIGAHQQSQMVGKLSKRGESSSREIMSQQQNLHHFLSKEYSPPPSSLNQQHHPKESTQSLSQMNEFEKEIEIKNQQLAELLGKNKKQENEIQNLFQQLRQESQSKKELEELIQSKKQETNKEYLEQVRILLREREPNLEQLMELTLKKEKELQERKDAKILEILKIKDKQIEDLQQRGVLQETEYGNLAQSYQDLKRKMRIQDEEFERQREQYKSIVNQLEQSKRKLQMFENGFEQQQIFELNAQLEEQSSNAMRLQEQVELQQQEIQERDQANGVMQEALDRMREQIMVKDQKLMNFEQAFQEEQQRRVSNEENVKSLLQQINLLNQEKLNDKSMNVQKQKSDKDLSERIDKLQNEKYELMTGMEDLRREQQKEFDRLRYVYERLVQLRGNGGVTGNALNEYQANKQNKSNNMQLIEKIERKVEDVGRVLKEMEEDNIDLNKKFKKQNEMFVTKDKELEMMVEENEELNKKLKKNQKQKKVQAMITQTEIELIEMTAMTQQYQQLRRAIDELEQLNQVKERENCSLKKQCKDKQLELERANQEISFLVQGSKAGNNNKKYSLSTQSELNNNNNYQVNNNEEVISRLNAKVTQMKINEDQLIEQINQMKSQMQSDSVALGYGGSGLLTGQKGGPFQQTYSSDMKSELNRKQLVGFEEKVGEYEMIVIEQREMLIKLEQEKSELAMKVEEILREKQREQQQLQQKVQSLKELNKKYEQIHLSNKISNSGDVGNQQMFLLSSKQSDGSYSQSLKSTTAAAETERMRQYCQQLELGQMNLKHQLEEIKIERDSLRKECSQIKQDLQVKDSEYIKIKQFYKSDNNGGGSSSTNDLLDISKLQSRLLEQKQQIKQYEQELNQYRKQQNNTLEVENNQQQFGIQNKNINSSQAFASQRIEDLIKTNERLRKEHQQALLGVSDIKEDYVSKLQSFTELYEREKLQYKNENQSLQRKLDQLQSQISYMEKKEIRLFGQLEEAKTIQMQESEEKEKRTRELEELLFKKEEILNDLEREIKQKERSLQERQEQIAVLIEALENEHSNDQLRQKVLNLSAELCSLKAIEAQLEKKSNELIHQLKKVEMNNSKTLNMYEQEKKKGEEVVKEMKKLEKDNEERLQKNQELENRIEGIMRELYDWKHKSEREEFQLQMKEECITQLREQIKRSEYSFKEEIEKIKQDFSQRILNHHMTQQQQQKKSGDCSAGSKYIRSFKQVLNNFHLIISEYLQNKKKEEEEENSNEIIINELEKVITIASSTIEGIQSALDNERILNCQLQNEYKTLSLNKILMARLEGQSNQIQQLQRMYNQREQERGQYLKSKEQTQSKLLREQELKSQFYEKQVVELSEELEELRQKMIEMKAQNEELSQQVFCFGQELENEKIALEKRAELTVDERFKVKFEQIKTYFDSNIAKVLLNQGGMDKYLELGREICALKLLNSKQESKLLSYQQDKEANEINLKYFKELVQQQQSKYRELSVKYNQQQMNNKSQDICLRMELERKKQENISLEKEIMKQKDMIEERNREIIRLEEELKKYKDIKNLNKSGASEQDENLVTMYEEKIEEMQKMNKQLQENLMELRGQHIQELEELRQQYDIETSEVKREVNKQKLLLEKKFNPGQAPGEVLEMNQQLKSKINEYQSALDNSIQENVILRKKLEQEKILNESQRNNMWAHKQALADLETTLMEISSVSQQHIVVQHQQQHQQQQQQQQTQMNNFQKHKPEEGKRKSGKGQGGNKTLNKSGINQNQLHFNKEYSSGGAMQDEREHTNNVYQQSHSHIMQADSSLDVSAFTSMNIPLNNNRASYQKQGGAFIGGGGNSKQFVYNPPLIVKALVQSKVNEMSLKKRVEEVSQVEIQLRQQIQKLIEGGERRGKDQSSYVNEDIRDIEEQEYKKRVIELEIENQDLKIQLTQQSVENNMRALNNQTMMEAQSLPIQKTEQDYMTLLNTVLILSTQIGQYENGLFKSKQQQELEGDPLLEVEQAQRIVIKNLVNIVNGMKGSGSIDLTYAPAQDQDRKVWYLELLEQQVDASENIIKNLQNFIKKLTIEIQGNLQSAAQIKAASMDLAQNTKQTSEEIFALKCIVGLVKQDLLSLKNKESQLKQTKSQQQQQQQNIMQKTMNPFTDNISPLISQQQQQTMYNYDQLLSTTENLQNKLTIVEKVKGTLEKEIIELKINQTQELQQLQQQLKLSVQQRDQLLETNEELHSKVISLESNLEKFKQEINQIGEERQQNLNTLLEKEREKDLMQKNKVVTSKHLQKLQQDLHDWRKQADENIECKEKVIKDQANQINVLNNEKERLKAENQMLRRNEKDRVKNKNDLQVKLEEENKQLMDKLNEQIEERKKEIEFWVAERATMREMIDQLESEKVDIDTDKNDTQTNKDIELKQIKKKTSKKIKQKEAELKSKEKQLQDLKDELTKIKLSAISLEQKTRESNSKLIESEERCKYFSHRLKEVELEKDLILAEKNNAVASNDISAQQIQEELNSLRECFAKLKVERDSLISEIEMSRVKEKEWKSQFERMNEEFQLMENQVLSKEKEQNTNMKIYEQKCATLMQDVKFLRQDNDRLKSRYKEEESRVNEMELKFHQGDLKSQDLSFQIEEKGRQIIDMKIQIKQREESISQLQGQLIQNECLRQQEMELFKSKVNEIKESHQHVINLYENQIECILNKWVKEGKKGSQEKADQIINISQREAVIKCLKKENTTIKTKLNKLKAKHLELKQKQEENQENNANLIKAKKTKTNNLNKNQQNMDLNQQFEKQVLKIAQLLASEDGYKQIYDQLQNQSQVMFKQAELESELVKSESNNKVLSQELKSLKEQNQQLIKEIEEIQQKDGPSQMNTSMKQQQQQTVLKQQKAEIKQLSQELLLIKQEWISPEEKKQMLDQIRELNNQLKILKEEVQRKREVITTLKQQRDQNEQEANQVIQDMEGLKDDNAKLQKLMKENAKNLQSLKEIKINNEFLKTQEKQLKEELQNNQEKAKQMKIDLQRKEQIIKDLKDRLDQIQDEVTQGREKQSEIEKLKEIIRKVKLELEIKDNSVKQLKQKLGHTEEQLENERSQLQSSLMTNSNNLMQTENQYKQSKLKLKKYENYLRKSLEAIRRIGKQLTNQNEKRSSGQSKKKSKQVQQSKNDNAMLMSEFDREIYKDSVNILGVSIDELEEFMNPSVSSNKWGGSSNNKSENLEFIAKLDKALSIPESLNNDLDQICNYCVKLINEIGNSTEDIN